MKFLKKGSKVSVEEVKTSSGLEYDIKFDAGGQAGEITVAKCWDYLLAEKLRDAVSEYMAEEYKVVGQEDAEMLEESLDKPIMPDTAVAGKPIAVKMVRTEDPKEAFTLHSLRDCIDDFEKEVFTKVMTTGKPYDGYDTVAVPVLQRGVPKKYQPLLSKFSESKKVNESVDGEPWPEEELKKLDNYIVDAKLAISQATSFIEGNASSGLDSMEEVWTHLNSTYNDLDDIQDMFH
jgi:hypothetical protein